MMLGLMRESHVVKDLARFVRPVFIAGFSVGLCALLVAGCSSAPSTPKGFTAVTLKPGVLVPFKLANNARADVHAGTCKKVSGTWEMTGIMRNPSSATKSFQIVVDFVTVKGDTVISTAEVNIAHLARSSSVDWTATGAKGKSDIACVIRQAQKT
jgi:hypothetical protein